MSRGLTQARSRETRSARETRGSTRTQARTRAIRTRRTATALAVLVLTLWLSACGINAGDKLAPEPVTNVTATPGVGFITVSWQDNSTFETGFVVSRKTLATTEAAGVLQENGTEGFVVLATVDPDVTAYEDRDMTLGAEYRYSVTATNDGADATPVEPEAPEPVEVLNGAPVADARAVTVAEDGTVDIALSGSDPEGFDLSYTVVAAPSHGSLTGTAPALVYTPTPEFHGSDSFTFRVSDGAVDSAVATVSIDVQPENDPPVAEAQSLTGDEDHALEIVLTGTDTENSELTFTIVDGPKHGVLVGEGSARTYTPDANYFGTDAFTFAVSDGRATSAAAEVLIGLAAQPDAPTFTSMPVVEVDEDHAYGYQVVASDADGDSLAFSYVQLPDWLHLTDHGNNTATVSSVAGRPSNEDVGSEFPVELRVEDGTGSSNSQSFTVRVVNVNDAPIIQQGETIDVSVAEEATTAPLVLSATDDDAGDALAWSIASGPEHGIAGLDAEGSVSYTGDVDFFGADAFVVEVSDGSATDTITVQVTVGNVQDLPIAIDDGFTTAEDTGLEANVLTQVDADGAHDYDPDGDPIHVVDSDLAHAGVDPVSGPSHGSLALDADGRFTYQPNANYYGSDSFVYAIRDDNSGENVLATVTIEVTPVDDAPVIDQGDNASIAVTEEATSAPLALSASDVEGDALAWSVETQAGNGTAHVDASGSVTYTGEADFAGEDAFVIAVSANGAKDTIAVTVTVENVNDAPVIDQGDTVAIATDEDVTSDPFVLSVTDVDAGDSHTWTIGAPAAHGTASVDASGKVTYHGNADYNGADTFTVVVTDGEGVQDEISIDVTVTPVADAPTVGDDTGTARHDEVLTAVDHASGGTTSYLLTNDVDVDGDAIRVSLFDTVSTMGASVNVVTNGQFSYDPRGVAALDLCGVHTDTFGYTVKDDTGLSTEGTVTVTVLRNCPPTDLALSSTHILENQSAGTLVGAFSTFDPNQDDTHTYSLVSGEGSDHNGAFSISGSYLVANASFDYETQSTYLIRVRTDDGRGGTYDEAFVISVGDLSPPTADRTLSWEWVSSVWSDSSTTVGQTDDYVVRTSPDVVYKLTVAEGVNTFFTFDTCTNNFDTYLFLLDEDGTPLVSDDDACDVNLGSRFSYSLVPGESYYIVVDGFSQDEGDYTLQIQN